MHELFRFCFIVIFTSAVISCSDGEQSAPIDDGQNDSAKLYVNPDDNRIISNETEEGKLLLTGNKDENGVVTDITSIDFTSPTGDEFEYFFNDADELEKMVDNNGTTYDFVWSNDSVDIVASGIDENGIAVQINTTVDLSDIGSSPKPLASKVATNKLAANTSLSNKTSMRSDSAMVTVTPKAFNTYQQRELSTKHSDIIVTECGNDVKPEWIDVKINAALNDGSPRIEQAKYLSGNLYKASFSPTQAEIAAVNVSAACSAIDTTLSATCGLSHHIFLSAPAVCGGLAGVAGAYTAGISAPAVFAGCTSAFSGYVTACAVNGGGLAEGAPSVSGYLCEEVDDLVDSYLNSQNVVSLTPKATSHKFNVTTNATGSTEDVTNGVFPKLAVDIVYDEPFTWPPKIKPSTKDYKASFEVGCVTSPVEVTIEVIGKDGYRDVQTSIVNTDSTVDVVVPFITSGSTTDRINIGFNNKLKTGTVYSVPVYDGINEYSQVFTALSDNTSTVDGVFCSNELTGIGSTETWIDSWMFDARKGVASVNYDGIPSVGTYNKDTGAFFVAFSSQEYPVENFMATFEATISGVYNKTTQSFEATQSNVQSTIHLPTGTTATCTQQQSIVANIVK